MSRQGYDVVVDVDQEGDLGHTDLQEDNLEFHTSNFNDPAPKAAPHSAPNNGHSHKRSASATLAGKRHLWSVSFYAQFFDVDTNEVLRRCFSAILPMHNFLDVLDGAPDLYGPFWLATTVVVILFLAGTMSWKLAAEGHAPGKHVAGYDFTLLSGAAGLIYGYTAVVPCALWAALRFWAGSEAASLLETLALYGYANVIWIPVALVSWSALDALNYAFVGIGLAVSVAFLLRNIWPLASGAPKQRAKLLLIVVAVLHFGLAVAIKFLFFAHNSPARRGKKADPAKEPPAEGGDDGKESDSEGEADRAATMLVVRAAMDLLRL